MLKIFWMILIIVLGLIYILSPIDGIPDVIPVFGWLDDTFLVGVLAYYLRYKRFPKFICRFTRIFFQRKKSDPGPRYRENTTDAGQRENGRMSPRDPYEVLGVLPGASWSEIQAAYRSAAQQYHPDKVAHLGEEFQALAQKKFIEIQEAYQLLQDRYA